MPVPYWIQDAVFYQIFPDRFANGDPSNDPPNVQAWGSPPTIHGFQGGDLRGILQKFDYLLDLGVNALYLNPIFLAPSTHRYNTHDYYAIDPMLGDSQDFRALLETAHANGMRVILDGVFNHCGRGFFAFADLLENQEHSPYKDWFHVKSYPVEAYGPGDATTYLGWWNFKSLPKFNTHNPRVRRYLLDVARYWIEQGADGWRLDVPNEIDDDSFWAEFRHVVKTANREAYLLGEIWTADPRWVGHSHFDGLMNYPLRQALLDLLNNGSAAMSSFAEKVEKLLEIYPAENLPAMYNTLGSHDTERIQTALNGEIGKVKFALGFQFAFPGVPAIYMGDEIGLTGGKDPDCRGAFPWEPDKWQAELHGWTKTLVSLRRRMPCLRRGKYLRVFLEEKSHCFAFARKLGDQSVLVCLNASPVQRHLRLPVAELGWTDGRIVHDLTGIDEYIVSGDHLNLRLPAWGAAWIG